MARLIPDVAVVSNPGFGTWCDGPQLRSRLYRLSSVWPRPSGTLLEPDCAKPAADPPAWALPTDRPCYLANARKVRDDIRVKIVVPAKRDYDGEAPPGSGLRKA